MREGKDRGRKEERTEERKKEQRGRRVEMREAEGQNEVEGVEWKVGESSVNHYHPSYFSIRNKMV